MGKYLNIMRLIRNNELPEEFDNNSEELKSILNLIEDGNITANLEPIYGSTFVNIPKLTIKGEKELSNSKLSTKTKTAVHTVSAGTWKVILAIAVIVISGIILSALST